MSDEFKPVGKRARSFALIATGLATCLFAALLLLSLYFLLNIGFVDPTDKPAWLAVVVFALLTLIPGWMFLRLLRGTTSTNRVTMMPTWFLVMVGVLFTSTVFFVAIKKDQPWLLLELTGFGLPLVFLPLLLRRHRPAEKSEQAGEEQAASSEDSGL